jgi:hypothetical protein
VQPADGRIGILEGLEAGCRLLADGRYQPDIEVTYAEAGKTREESCNRRADVLPPAYPSLFSFPDIHSGLYRPFEVAKCVADAMLQLATAVQPTHVTGGQLLYLRQQSEGRFASAYFLSKRPEILGPVAQSDLARVYRPNPDAIDPDAPWPADETLYSIGVPSASDAATWALLAVDYYRVAMMEAAWELACPTRDAHSFDFIGATDRVTVEELRSVELMDSVNKLEEAAELAQRNIDAAADARLATMTDKRAALAENWVARFDSRLEGIRAYLPMPPQMFDGWRAAPLFRVDDPLLSMSAEASGAVWFSTDPYWWAAEGVAGSNGTRYTKRVTPTGCFIHTPEGPAPQGTIPLVTVAVDSNSARVQSASLIDGLAGLGDLGVIEYRLEGYLEATPVRGATIPVYACARGEGAGFDRWVSGCGACPGGASGRVVGYAFDRYPSRAQLAGHFPIVTAGRESPADRAAEHMLRITRVDPRLPDGDADEATIVELIERVARAYAEDHSGVFGEMVTVDGAVDVEGVLRLLGVTREAFVTAARRVTQQALALGRGITPDPAATGSVPRVLGTEERWDSAEAVYYQALAQRSSHLAKLYWPGASLNDVEIMRGAHLDRGYFSMQHAHHGVYHAEAALLSVLRHPDFRLRRQGRLVSKALETVEAHLAGNLEGWASVRTGAAGGNASRVGRTSIVLHDLRASAADAQTAAAMYEIWFSEAGLDCALGKTECNETDFRFSGTSPTVENGNVHFELFQSGSRGVPPTARGLRACESSACSLRADRELRLYVTRRDARTGMRNPLIGFTLDGLHPVVTRDLPLFGAEVGDDRTRLGVDPVQFIPFVLGPPAEDITTGVAPDPQNPEDGETHCSGISEITLEDELMEATKRKDDIESSFAYYLDVAQDAAERADRLGEELIRAGEAIDVRSEIAREKLEELCGGVVNLERIQTLADAQGKDLPTLLTEREIDSSLGETQALQSDLAGLANCLGLGEGFEEQNVAVGSENLCFWRFNSDGVELPPCVAPPELPDGTPIQVPGSEQRVACPTRAEPCAPSVFGLAPNDPNFRVDTTDSVLGVTTGLEIAKGPVNVADQVRSAERFNCVLSQLTQHSLPYATGYCGYDPSDVRPWFHHGAVRAVGQRLGVRLEPFFVAVITLDGKDWIRLGRPESGFAASGAWPCARFPTLASDNSTRCADGILCGLGSAVCEGVDGSPPEADQWLEGQRRLIRAVWITKALGGAPYSNFEHYKWAYSNPEEDAASPVAALDATPRHRTSFWNSAVGMGAVPEWFAGLELVAQRQVMFAESWGAGNHNKFYGIGAGTVVGGVAGCDVTQDGEVLPARTESGIWYRGKRPDTAKRNGPLNDTWCVPSASVHRVTLPQSTTSLDVYLPDVMCVEGELASKRKLQALPMQAAFDRSFNTDPDAGWILDMLERPRLNHPQGGRLSFKRDRLTHRQSCTVVDQNGTPSGSLSYDLRLLGDLPQVGFDEPRDIERVSAEELADVLALVAAANADGGGAVGCETALETVPIVSGPEDFPRVRANLVCAAERVEDMVRRMMITGIPQSVAQTAAAANGVQNVVPALRGRMGESVATLTGWLQSYSAATSTVAQALRDIGSDFEIIGAQLRMNESDEELTDLSMTSKISAAAGRCGAAVGEAHSPKGWIGGGIAAAAAICADSITQISIAMLANAEQQDILDEQRKLILVELAERVTQRMDSVDDARRVLGESHAKVSSVMAEIDSIRNQATREVSKALGLESDEAGRVFPVSSVLRANYNTAKVRYQRALWQAKQAAQLARVALEQRVGRDLSEVDYDLPLVEKPSTWADTLCATTGIDYDRIRRGNVEDGTAEDYNYAEAHLPSGKTGFHFVGDYVANLKRVRDSWSLAHPFEDGDDTVVVSLRDDLVRTTQSCDVEGWNELLQTATATDVPRAEESLAVWEATCSEDACAVALSESSSPLSCYATDRMTPLAVPSADSHCPDFGPAGELWPRAVTLRRGPVPPEQRDEAAIERDDNGDLVPPSGGIEYWYRADDCTESVQNPGYVESCRNRGANPAGQDRTAQVVNRTAGVLSVTRSAQGIGGRPTLQIPGQTAFLTTVLEPYQRDAFTISVAYRVDDGGHVSFYSVGGSLPDGRSQWLTFGVNRDGAGTASLYWQANPVGGSVSAVLGVVGRSPYFYRDLRPARGGILTLVVDGREATSAAGEWRGTRIFVNGNLVSSTDRTIPPQPLGGTLFNPAAGGGQLAEWIAYGRALSNMELRALHEYLGKRYAVDLDEPAFWVEADEMARVAEGGGASQVSGFVGASDSIVDRVRAATYGRFGAGGGQTAPAGLNVLGEGDESHYALDFAHGQLLSVPNPGYFHFRDEGSSAASGVQYAPPRHYSATLVARLDAGTGEQHLWQSVDPASNWGSMGQAVLVDASTGAVILRHNGVRHGTEPGVVQVGQPFVVSVRGSTSAPGATGESGVVELFVNGRKLLMADGAPDLWYQRLSNGYANPWLGSIAEYELHLQPKSDSQVRALHAELAKKYGLVLESDDSGALTPPLTSTPQYQQTVEVRAGTYWLSWYQHGGQPRLDVALGRGLALTEEWTYVGEDIRGDIGARYLTPGWARHYGKVVVPADGTLTIAWLVPDEAEGVWFAAPQLERTSGFASLPPRPFFSTDHDKSAPRAACEDVEGKVFRTDLHWRRGVEYACNEQLVDSCRGRAESGLLAPLHYREISFTIAQEAIDQGKLLDLGGFSRGNYNYRHKTVAVNVVGTRVKSCENSQFPSACQTGNFVQYSIRHDGPYEVRNHEGLMYDAPLFTGRIQQGKALLAERYLTNPVSGTDRSLVSSFVSEQLWGRPLDGQYVLRIYDADGLDWDAVEDVQLILNYRFWTRLD